MRTITIDNHQGDIQVACQACGEDWVSLRIRSEEDDLVNLCVRIHDETGRIVCERLIRDPSAPLRLRLRSAGRYTLEIRPSAVSGKRHTETLTWSDWHDLMDFRQRPNAARPRQGFADAILRVA